MRGGPAISSFLCTLAATRTAVPAPLVQRTEGAPIHPHVWNRCNADEYFMPFPLTRSPRPAPSPKCERMSSHLLAYSVRRGGL